MRVLTKVHQKPSKLHLIDCFVLLVAFNSTAILFLQPSKTGVLGIR